MSKSTNTLLKVVIVLLLAIIVAIVVFGIGVYFSARVFPTAVPPTPTPSTFTITLRTDINFQRSPIEIIQFYTNSPTDITFSTNDIRYNGQPASSYGSFAPVFGKIQINSLTPLSQFTIDTSAFGSMVDQGGVYFPRENGSPWSSGVIVQMSVTTANAQGSTTFTLP